MMLLLIAALVGGAFLFSARNSFSTVDQWRARDEALLGAQSGLEQAKYALDQTFRTNYQAIHSWDSLNVLANLNSSGNYVWTNSFTLQPYVITVRVTTVSASVIRSTNNYTAEISLTNMATATYGGVTRRVREVVRYLYDASPALNAGSVFDNAYYVDQLASFNGVNGDFNGDVRAAGDIDFQNCNSLKFNGDVFAGGDVLNYSSGSYTWYDSAYVNNTRARPFLYTDRNNSNSNTYWPQGYDGHVDRYENVAVPNLPYVGPLSEYEKYAIASTGTLTAAGLAVNGVWGDSTNETSRLGITNGLDVGCLVITNGATINGVIVARGDVYIKGTIRGQGAIYAGRNIYVIGNVSYASPPSWTKPDSNPTNTALRNSTNDFLALCAKGNLVFGDDFKSFLQTLAKSPITATHASDVTDLELGYVSYTSGGVPYFDGDYTATDGENHDAVRTDGSQRAYYDPILGDAKFQSLGVSATIGKIDGVVYANHLVAGTAANGMQFNGAVICRDEVIKRTGNLYLNWDIRLGSQSREGRRSGGFALIDLLPRQATVYRTIKWTELLPQ